MNSAVRTRSSSFGPLFRVLGWVLFAVGWALLAWSALAAFGVTGRVAWFLEVPANFPILILGAAALGLLLVWLGGNARSRVLAMVLVLVSVIAARVVRPDFVASPASTGFDLKLMTWNAFAGSLDVEKAVAEIRRMNPDVISFTEFETDFYEEIDPLLRSSYPYYLGSPDNGFIGMGVYSRFPISDWHRNREDARRRSSCLLAVPGAGVCRLVFLHPEVPDRLNGFRFRARSLEAASEDLTRFAEPIVVMGDFNASWASADLRAFCRKNALVPADRLLGTWNAGFPMFLRASIDHVLVAKDVFVPLHAETGQSGCGSDHLPVMATVRWRSVAGQAVAQAGAPSARSPSVIVPADR